MGKKVLEKIVDGVKGFKSFIYAGTAALCLSGCGPIPTYVNLSEDGRYIAYQANQEGEFSNDKEDQLTMVSYDTKTGQLAMSIPLEAPVYSPVVSSDAIAYVRESKNTEFYDTVVISNQYGKTVIKDALCPNLSNDSQYLVYAINRDKNEKHDLSDYSLEIRDLKTGLESRINKKGGLPDFSPDDKNIAYYQFLGKDLIGVSVYNLRTKNNKRVDTIDFSRFSKKEKEDMEPPLFIHFLNNDTFIYQAFDSSDDTDLELFIANIDGRKRQLTKNKVNELFPNVHADGTVSYCLFDEKGEFKETYLISGLSGNSPITKKSPLRGVPVARGNSAIALGENNSVFLLPSKKIREITPEFGNEAVNESINISKRVKMLLEKKRR